MGPDNLRLLQGFAKDCQTRRMSHNSILSYLSAVRIFLDFVEQRQIVVVNVDKSVLKDYIDHLLDDRKVSYKTLSYQFSALSAFYEWMVFEETITVNPVPPVRKRYLQRYKGGVGLQEEGRKLISVKEMGDLVRSIVSSRDRAVVVLLAKTGVRRGELVSIDLDDVDMELMSVKLKPKAKRTNRLVFFDEEGKRALLDWLNMRRLYAKSDCKALFISTGGGRLNKNHIYDIVVSSAERAGLHIPTSEKLEDHFTPHCCRHWFTTHLMRAGMPREHVQELRGDVRPDAVDIYYHIDPDDLRKSYLAHMPRLGL